MADYVSVPLLMREILLWGLGWSHGRQVLTSFLSCWSYHIISISPDHFLVKSSELLLHQLLVGY